MKNTQHTPKLHICFCAALLVAVIVLLAGCSKEQQPPQAPPPAKVIVTTPAIETVEHYANFTGKIEPFEFVEIFPRVEGVLEEVHFSEGQMVKKGDLLFTLDRAPYQARLRQAEADLAIKGAELDLAKTTYDRRENAYRDKAVSEVQLMEAKATLASAQAGVIAAKAAVTSATLDLSYTRIIAPVSGRIGRKLVDIGNLVTTNKQTMLTTIVHDTTVYAYFTMSERDLLRYKELLLVADGAKRGGQRVKLGLADQSGYPFEGTIDYIGNQIDTETGTIAVRAVFNNTDQKLMAGLFARVQVAIAAPTQELVVPDIAFGKDQQGAFVMVVQDDNTVRYQPVKTGILSGKMRVVTTGLTVTDRVIVKGVQKARPGAPVTPVDAAASDMAAKPAA